VADACYGLLLVSPTAHLRFGRAALRDVDQGPLVDDAVGCGEDPSRIANPDGRSGGRTDLNFVADNGPIGFDRVNELRTVSFSGIERAGHAVDQLRRIVDAEKADQLLVGVEDSAVRRRSIQRHRELLEELAIASLAFREALGRFESFSDVLDDDLNGWMILEQGRGQREIDSPRLTIERGDQHVLESMNRTVGLGVGQQLRRQGVVFAGDWSESRSSDQRISASPEQLWCRLVDEHDAVVADDDDGVRR